MARPKSSVRFGIVARLVCDTHLEKRPATLAIDARPMSIGLLFEWLVSAIDSPSAIVLPSHFTHCCTLDDWKPLHPDEQFSSASNSAARSPIGSDKVFRLGWWTGGELCPVFTMYSAGSASMYCRTCWILLKSDSLACKYGIHNPVSFYPQSPIEKDMYEMIRWSAFIYQKLCMHVWSVLFVRASFIPHENGIIVVWASQLLCEILFWKRIIFILKDIFISLFENRTF